MGARPITVETELTDEDRALLSELRDLLAWHKRHVAPTEGLLTTDEAATLAGVKPVTIRSWVMKGHLPVARRAGNRMRFRREDVLNQVDPQSPAE